MRAISSGLPLGFDGKLRQHLRPHSHEGVRPRSAFAGLLARYVHHARTAGGVEVREFAHFSNTWIMSPAVHDSRLASATRKPLARQKDTISFDPLQGTGVTSPHSILAGRKRVSPGRCLKSWVSLASRHGTRRGAASADQIDGSLREEFEGDHGGNRIAGQSEEKLAARLAEHQRRTGLDGDAVEIELGAEIAQDIFHQVVLARRDSAGNEQEVGGQPAFDEFARFLRLVASDRKQDRAGAGADSPGPPANRVLELRI